MRVTEFIWQVGGAKEVDGCKAVDDHCAVCGADIKTGLPLTSVVSSNFTNWDAIANPNGRYACVACAWCFKERDLRFKNFIATNSELILIKRDGLENVLFDMPQPPFVFCVTQSYKKHNAFRAKVSHSQKEYHVREEDKLYLFRVDVLRPAYQAVREAYRAGAFTKTELLTGHYNMARIKKFGLAEWSYLEGALKPIRPNPAYGLLIHALNKEEKESGK